MNVGQRSWWTMTPLAVLALTVSCAEPTGVPDVAGQVELATPAAMDAKGGKPGGGGDVGSELIGDVAVADFGSGDANSLGSTCPTTVKVGQWHLDFGPSECLVVTLTWNDASGFEPYPLTDDVRLVVRKENGRNGRITHVRLLGQDVIGEAGVAHESDEVPVASPVVPDKAGFTLHVHAPRVEVWRLSEHVGGDRVALIGWVSIGDMIYTAR